MQSIYPSIMNKSKKWRVTTLAVVGFMLLSLNPEVRLLGLLIEAVGIETILVALQAQIILIAGIFYRRWVAPILGVVNGILEKIDPLYFRPNLSLIRAYPRMLLHSVPFLVTVVHIGAVGALLSHA